MKKILYFIVYSNLFIALCCAVLTLQTTLIFEETNTRIFEYTLINFIATFCLYNLQRLYYSAMQPESIKYAWYIKNRRLIFTLIILLFICSFNFLWNFFIENKMHLFGYSILSVASLAYFLPPIQLKKIGVLKPFLISAVFVAVTIIIPLDFKITGKVLFYSFAQFCFVSILCVLFDIRDVNEDRGKGVRTIPVLVGLKKTKIICAMILISYFIIATRFFNSSYLVTLLLLVCILTIIIMLTNEKRNNYFYLVIVDGMLLLQFSFFAIVNYYQA
ncbi:MAG: UbiA family prenyltransferase [Bacteroidota bacterium]|nr:UbiA family prenyltransferase [Bacteroidota bacterium]